MIVGVIQARLGSTRLPGKVLRELANGLTMLAFQMERLRRSAEVAEFVVATSDAPSDDPLAAYCAELGVRCVRGSEQDVLGRFARVADLLPEAKSIVRLTADCVLHHGAVVDNVVRGYKALSLDYFSNSNYEPLVIEDGFDVEVFSREALLRADAQATLRSDREHVTPYIKNSGLFRCGWMNTVPGYRHKLSVDTLEDFALANTIIAAFHPRRDFTMQEVLKALEANPEWLELNKGSIPNSGYLKSLKEDQQTD